MNIIKYNQSQSEIEKPICEQLMDAINKYLPEAESKIWHRHPVWFLNGNPIVGYVKLKDGIRLMFWSGATFDEPELKPGTGKFKDASKLYTSVEEIDNDNLKQWLDKAKSIQWDYKNVMKKKGRLDRLS